MCCSVLHCFSDDATLQLPLEQDRHYKVLQCGIVCCSELQRVAVHTSDDATFQLQLKEDHRYSMLQRVAECCSVFQCVAVCCSVYK